MNWAAELSTTRFRYGDRTGIVDAEGEHSIGEVIDHAAGIADNLLGRGLRPGDFVATVFHNSALAASASYGVSLAGLTDVPINPLLSQAELEHALRCTGAKFILIDGKAAPPPDLDVPAIDIREIAPRAMTAHGWPGVDPEALSRIVFTSGTTGFAKGAIHTHRGRWTGTLMLRASLPLMPDRSNRILLMTPFSHGSSLLTFAYLAHGASVHLMKGVDPTVILPLLASGEISEVFAPPTVLAKLTEAAADKAFSELNYPLRMILTGTAPLTPTIYRNAVERFGEIIRVTYGKSEIFNPITVLEPEETAASYANMRGEGLCVGWPATGVEVEIRDEANTVLPRGEVGQIYLNSPHLFSGYMMSDGVRMLGPGEFHDTGDMGRIDEAGRLFLVSRQSDMMKSGGYKVAPDEVERLLAPALPGTEMVVLGFPSDYWGEIVTVIAQSPPTDWQERLGPAIADMTSYKRPRLFASIDTLPRNSIGKIARAHLRRWLAERYDLVEKPRPVFLDKQSSGEQR